MGTSLFLGIETFNWSASDFDIAINFCKAHHVDRLIVKVYEITQGEWNLPMGGARGVVEHITSQGIDCLPYGFFYGDDPVAEGAAINKYVTLFGRFCLDMESSFDGNPDKVQRLVTQLASAGNLWISTWANPTEHNWLQNLTLLTPFTAVWMPQVYDDSLAKAMYLEWPRTSIPIEPTFHIEGTPWQDAKSFSNFSLWEYQLGVKSPGLLDAFVSVSKGVNVSTYPTNAGGSIVNALQVSEFQPQHSEFECGAFAVAVLGRSTNYNVPNTMSVDNLVSWAEAAYKATTGSNDPSNTAGASKQDMYTMLKFTQEADPFGTQISSEPLHWWDTDISSTSVQSHDLATIIAAVQHGYPLIATVSEASVFDVELGRNPYWWGPTGNHILVWVGVDSAGNLLALDPANVEKGDGNLQTPKTTLPWPRHYRASSIDNSWATLIRTPWLPAFPNNNPLSWPPYVPPAPPTPPPPPAPVEDQVQVIYDATNKQLIFMDSTTKQAVYRINL